MERESWWRLRSHLAEKLPAFGDREHVATITRPVRDLTQAVELMANEILPLSGTTNLSSKVELECHFIKSQNRTRVAQNLLEDIERSIDSLVTRAERHSNKCQEALLRRLTLVASIFLPLTLACSVLSMSSRVKRLGALCWDRLGIVVIISMVVATG